MEPIVLMLQQVAAEMADVTIGTTRGIDELLG